MRPLGPLDQKTQTLALAAAESNGRAHEHRIGCSAAWPAGPMASSMGTTMEPKDRTQGQYKSTESVATKIPKGLNQLIQNSEKMLREDSKERTST